MVKKYMALCLVILLISIGTEVYSEEKTEKNIIELANASDRELVQLFELCGEILQKARDTMKDGKPFPSNADAEFLKALPEYTKFWVKMASYFDSHTPESDFEAFQETHPQLEAALNETIVTLQYLRLRFSAKCPYYQKLLDQLLEWRHLKVQLLSDFAKGDIRISTLAKSDTKISLPKQTGIETHAPFLREITTLSERALNIYKSLPFESSDSEIDKAFRPLLRDYRLFHIKLGSILDSDVSAPLLYRITVRTQIGFIQSELLALYLGYRLHNEKLMKLYGDLLEIAQQHTKLQKQLIESMVH